MAIVIGSPLPRRYSSAPATWGTWAKAARSVRKRPISRSGLIPSSGRRKSLKNSRSPKITEVFDCSACIGWGFRASAAAPARVLKAFVGVASSRPD